MIQIEEVTNFKILKYEVCSKVMATMYLKISKKIKLELRKVKPTCFLILYSKLYTNRGR